MADCGLIRANLILALAGVACLLCGCVTETAESLGERYWRTKDEADRIAWVTALDREGHDFKKHYKADYGPRGIYKFNAEVKLACFVITKSIAEKFGKDAFDDMTPDGPVHFEWMRRNDGSVDYHYSAPTNWEVFVRAFGDKKRKNPIAAANVDYQTSFSKGSGLGMTLMHHREEWKVAGPYADYPFPTNEIAAANNFSVALYEALQRIGLSQTNSVPEGRIWLATFHSNYPNGHTDFPPHFHIGIACRDGNQTHHFYVRREDGRITYDCFQDMSSVIDVWDRAVEFKLGDEFPAFDGHGRVVFRMKLLPDGTGLDILSPTKVSLARVISPSPKDFVDVMLPDGSNWKCALRVSVRDDPHAGILSLPEGEIRYDPMTGRRL